MIGSAGLYVLKPTLFEQALALLVAISGPTVAMILAVRKLNALNGADSELATGRRVTHAIVLYIKTAIISMAAIPFVIALLNNITYSLVLNQFRGVSLLHAAPILLIAVFVILYRGGKPFRQIGKLFRTPITLLWVVVGVVIVYAKHVLFEPDRQCGQSQFDRDGDAHVPGKYVPCASAQQGNRHASALPAWHLPVD